MSFAIRMLQQLSGNRDIFPFYHLVSDQTPAHTKHLYSSRNIRQFKNDLEFILKNYSPASFEEWAIGKKTNKPKVIFSFDDGLKEVIDIIAPIFYTKGLTGIAFINSAFVNNRDLFYRYKVSVIIDRLHQKGKYNRDKELLSLTYHDCDIINDISIKLDIDWDTYLKNEKPYLTFEQLNELKEKYGFTIGAHSVDHPMYSTISIDEQIRQTKESMAFVDQHFPNQQKLFAFPFTDYGVSDSFFNQMQASKIIDFSFGTAGMKDEELEKHVQRIPMEVSHFSGQKLINLELSNYFLKGLVGRREVRR